MNKEIRKKKKEAKKTIKYKTKQKSSSPSRRYILQVRLRQGKD